MWLYVLILLIGCFVFVVFIGAPYVPTHRRQVEIALGLLNLEPGQVVVDLGSGDGRFLLAAAKRGLRCIGYEVNPLLFFIAYLRLFRCRKQVSLKLQNFWRHELPQTDAIYVFLASRYMVKLDQKIRREAVKPLKLASYAFKIPGKKSQKRVEGVYLYRYKVQQLPKC